MHQLRRAHHIAAKRRGSFLATITAPGLWLQRITTKQPDDSQAAIAIHALNGAMELAPSLGLCARIVDLVSSGATLKANGLVEVEHIADITSRLIVNRTALKTRAEEITHWVDRFREACSAA